MAGGGKRGRVEGIVEVTKEEKLAMIRHQMKTLMDRVPTTTDKMLLDIQRCVMSRVELLDQTEDDGYLAGQIAAMGEAKLNGIIEFYSIATVGEQTAWKLSRFFLQEVVDVEVATEFLQRLGDLMHKSFELALTRGTYSKGRHNYRELKALAEKRLEIIGILRAHGHMQDHCFKHQF